MPDQPPVGMRRSIVFRGRKGRVITVTVLWTTPEKWERSPESTDPRWHKIQIAPWLVVAVTARSTC